ncbi:MAG: DUF4956 domain-containing protein [Acutalibacteraceae bacterium]|nr:DUF4956 domain-containing protein [Acutalibacteraceae bacterium]
MLNSAFSSIMTEGITPSSFAICTAVSLLCGLILSLSHSFKNPSTKSFAVTTALLPVIVEVVIMLVNGNLGTGIAVAGAFSLVRFRSAPGSAREILSIFTAMAAGLATGVGYVGIAIIFTLILSFANILYTLSGFGEGANTERELRITVPEDLNYTDMFEDLFKEHTSYHKLKSVKTTNMGSLYKLTYTLRLKNQENEKALIDAMRCRNGNLEIVSSYRMGVSEEL